MFANEASLTSKFSSMWPNIDGRHDIQTDVSRKPNGRQNYTHTKNAHTQTHTHKRRCRRNACPHGMWGSRVEICDSFYNLLPITDSTDILIKITMTITDTAPPRRLTSGYYIAFVFSDILTNDYYHAMW